MEAHIDYPFYLRLSLPVLIGPEWDNFGKPWNIGRTSLDPPALAMLRSMTICHLGSLSVHVMCFTELCKRAHTKQEVSSQYQMLIRLLQPYKQINEPGDLIRAVNSAYASIDHVEVVPSPGALREVA